MLTRLGRGITAVSVVVYAAGAWLGYPEAVVLATGGVLAVLAAPLWTLPRPSLTVRREITPLKAARGEAAGGVLHVTNTGRLRRSGMRAQDLCGTGAIDVESPRLRPGRGESVTYALPTDRRGEIPVGPLRLVRADPFGLARRVREGSGRPSAYARGRSRSHCCLPAATTTWRPDHGHRARRDGHLPRAAGVRRGRRPAAHPLAFQRAYGDADGPAARGREPAADDDRCRFQRRRVPGPGRLRARRGRGGRGRGGGGAQSFPVRVLTGDGPLADTRGGPHDIELLLDRLARLTAHEVPHVALDACRVPAGGSLVVLTGSRGDISRARSLRRRFDRVVCVRIRP